MNTTMAPWTPTPQSWHKKHQNEVEDNEHHHEKDEKKPWTKSWDQLTIDYLLSIVNTSVEWFHFNKVKIAQGFGLVLAIKIDGYHL